MIFDINQIAYSLAQHLEPYFEGVVFYEDPVQQSTNAPALFIQSRGASIEKKISNRYLWTLRLDLVYLLDFNLPDLQQQYQTAAQKLDFLLQHFLYIESVPEDPEEVPDTALVKTYARDWNIDLDELHYKFELRVWLTEQEAYDYMQTMELNLEVKDGTEV